MQSRRTLPFSTWAEFLEMCGLEEYREQYETLFKSNAIELDQVPDFNNEVLKELKIKVSVSLALSVSSSHAST